MLVGLLLLRGGFRDHDPGVFAAGVLIAVFSAGQMTLAIARRKTLTLQPKSTAKWLATATTGLLVAAACAALWSLRL